MFSITLSSTLRNSLIFFLIWVLSSFPLQLRTYFMSVILFCDCCVVGSDKVRKQPYFLKWQFELLTFFLWLMNHELIIIIFNSSILTSRSFDGNTSFGLSGIFSKSVSWSHFKENNCSILCTNLSHDKVVKIQM